ncbi:Lar family restriction alleviation protein [Ectopseudomonas mendocina]|nr:Lar family restriction alleviation protein [Pseudomonas mendocina]
MIEQKKMDAELLPCPHCNGGAEMRLYDGDYFVQCVECFASTAADYQTEQAAAEKWNRRGLPVGVPDAEALLTRLAEWCDKQPKQPWYSRTAGDMVRTFMACQPLDAPAAQPASEQPYPEGIAEDLERSDWTPIEALQWYAAGKHFDVVAGRTRIIDTGAVASNALKHASLEYLELKGDAELSELRAALSVKQSAPGEVEEVDVRGLQWLDTGHYRKKPPQFGYNPHDWNPLMTVAQHKRLMAAEIQKRFDGNEQSSRDHREELAQLAARDAGEVRVPVGAHHRVLGMLSSYVTTLAGIDYPDNDEGDYHQRLNENKRAAVNSTIAELRALLAQRDREGE